MKKFILVSALLLAAQVCFGVKYVGVIEATGGNVLTNNSAHGTITSFMADTISSDEIFALTYGGVGAARAAFVGNFTGDGSGITNLSSLPAAVVTNSYVQSWMNSAGLSYSNGVQSDLDIGVNVLKSAGIWTNLIQCNLMAPRFSPSNHVAFVGNNITATNDLYGYWGREYWSSNYDIVSLPSALSNGTVFVTYRCTALACNNGNIIPGQMLVSLSAMGSSFVVTAPATYNGQKIYTCSNSIWFGTNDVGSGTARSQIYRNMSGNWSTGTRSQPFTQQTLAICFSNGTASAWIDGNRCYFYNISSYSLTMTNDVVPYTTLNIGGGDTNWLSTVGPGQVFTNVGFGTQISCVQVYNRDFRSDTNAIRAATAFAFCTEDTDTITEFFGSSRMSFPATYYSYPSQGSPVTNEAVVIYSQMHPRELVIQNGYPGSYISNYNRTVAIPSTEIAPSAKFKTRRIIQDSGRNDAGGVASLATVLGYYNNYFLPSYSNGVQVCLWKSGYGANVSDALNLAKINCWSNLMLNFPFAAVFDEESRLTKEKLALGAYDIVHYGRTNTIAGYNAGREIAQLWTDKTPYLRLNAGSAVTASTGTYLLTNIYPYPVTVYISGGTVTGISKNARDIGQLSGGVRLFTGDILGITNSSAPTIWMDSTQP